MPRYAGSLTIPFWLDAANENEVEDAITQIMVAARRSVNVIREQVEQIVTEEPRPTNAELSTTV